MPTRVVPQREVSCESGSAGAGAADQGQGRSKKSKECIRIVQYGAEDVLGERVGVRGAVDELARVVWRYDLKFAEGQPKARRG